MKTYKNTTMNNTIALVTPLKNEVANIHRLLATISKQTIEIHTWIIVENDSNDGSKEILATIKKLQNVKNFEVISMQFEDKEYKLGTKYASIIQHGLNHIKAQTYSNEIDFLGILDADCFPQQDYYEKLTAFMNRDHRLGISSGLTILESGKADIRNPSWVRGNCRLWKKACLESAGYIVGPSADTLSVCKAVLNGWKVYPNPHIFVVTRDLGDRVNFSYYGNSAYFRGHTPIYALLKSGFLMVKGKKLAASQFWQGYYDSYKKKAIRIKDAEIINYYKHYMLNKIMKKINLSL